MPISHRPQEKPPDSGQTHTKSSLERPLHDGRQDDDLDLIKIRIPRDLNNMLNRCKVLEGIPKGVFITTALEELRKLDPKLLKRILRRKQEST